MAVDENMILSEDLAGVREIEFVYMFNDSVKKLIEALGVTRKIPKQAGTVLKAYKASGTLEDGEVAEGEVIPLSKYATEAVDFVDLKIMKWRKATTVEAITEKGYAQAVGMTTDSMLKDVQRGVKTTLFTSLSQGTGTASGATFQSALANAWGQLQVKFEDTDMQAVYFMNPLDVAEYLGSANITVQNAFGMNYVKDFMGLGTVILNSGVAKGKIYATAAENLVLYYIPVNGADIQLAFPNFTSDATGLIGITEKADTDNMTCIDTVISGIAFFAERLDGVVVATIGATTSETPSGTPSDEGLGA